MRIPTSPSDRSFSLPLFCSARIIYPLTIPVLDSSLGNFSIWIKICPFGHFYLCIKDPHSRMSHSKFPRRLKLNVDYTIINLTLCLYLFENIRTVYVFQSHSHNKLVTNLLISFIPFMEKQFWQCWEYEVKHFPKICNNYRGKGHRKLFYGYYENSA